MSFGLIELDKHKYKKSQISNESIPISGSEPSKYISHKSKFMGGSNSKKPEDRKPKQITIEEMNKQKANCN